MDLVNSETTNLCSYITFMVIYCLTTPMGVVIGVGVTEGPPIFDSTAVGLLQVRVYKILPYPHAA